MYKSCFSHLRFQLLDLMLQHLTHNQMMLIELIVDLVEMKQRMLHDTFLNDMSIDRQHVILLILYLNDKHYLLLKQPFLHQWLNQLNHGWFLDRHDMAYLIKQHLSYYFLLNMQGLFPLLLEYLNGIVVVLHKHVQLLLLILYH